jgi:hypothetical protein
MHTAFPITVASVATVAYAVFAVWTELSRKRAATRLEKLLSSGTGSTADPATMDYEGAADYMDIYRARNS